LDEPSDKVDDQVSGAHETGSKKRTDFDGFTELIHLMFNFKMCMCMNSNIYLSPHFSLKEMTDSQTAVKYGIANVPSEQEIDNLRRLCQGTLEPLREALQLPMVITSGFRTKALNDKLAHSSERSQHMLGQAADFWVQGSKFKVQGEEAPSRRELLIKAFRLIILDESIDYDQLILYPSFIHVSYVSRERNRRTILLGMRNGKLGYGKCSIQNALKIE
jgi:hypothetical protein